MRNYLNHRRPSESPGIDFTGFSTRRGFVMACSSQQVNRVKRRVTSVRTRKQLRAPRRSLEFYGSSLPSLRSSGPLETVFCRPPSEFGASPPPGLSRPCCPILHTHQLARTAEGRGTTTKRVRKSLLLVSYPEFDRSVFGFATGRGPRFLSLVHEGKKSGNRGTLVRNVTMREGNGEADRNVRALTRDIHTRNISNSRRRRDARHVRYYLY